MTASPDGPGLPLWLLQPAGAPDGGGRTPPSLGHGRGAPPRRPAPRVTRWLVAMGLLLGAAVIAAAGTAVWDARRHAIVDAEREMQSLSVAIVEQTSQLLRTVDLAFNGVRSRARAAGALADPEAFAAWADTERTHRILAAVREGMPQADGLMIVSATGEVLASSRVFPAAPRDLSDRDYFQRIRMGNMPLVIGAPVVNRATGKWAFHVVRRVEGPNGSFLGAEIAIFNLDHFHRAFGSIAGAISQARDGAVTMLREDATMLARYPAAERVLGRDFSATPQARRVFSAPEGEIMRIQSVVDGRDRLIVSRALPGYPLRVNVAFGMDAILAEWRELAWRIAVGAVFLLGLIAVAVAAVLRAGRAERRAAEGRREAEDSTVEHEARMRQVVEQMPVALAVFDRQMRYLAVSERFILEHPGAPRMAPAAYVGRSHYDTFANLAPHWRMVHLRVLSGETVEAEAEPFAQADGRMGWIRWHMAPWRRGDGSIGGATLFLEMVSERVEAEKALLAGEARLRETEGIMRLAMAGARIGSYRKDHLAGVMHATPGTAQLQGLPATDAPIPVAEWRRNMLPEDQVRIAAKVAEAQARHAAIGRYDYRLRSPEDGSIRYMEARTRYEYDGAGRLVGSLGVIIDVTDRIAAAQALRDSEERLRLALEATDEGLWDWHIPTGRRVYSDRWHSMLGYGPGELEPNETAWARLVHPEDHDRSVEAVRAHVAGETPLYACELRMRHRDGHWVWLLDRGKIVEWDAAEAPVRMVGTHQDISRRKAAEEALAAREAELRAVLDTVPECVKVVADDGRVRSINEAGARMVGAAPDRIIGLRAADYVAAQDRAGWEDCHRRVCAGEEVVFEYELTRPDGAPLRLASRSVPVLLPGHGLAHLMVSRDVTAQRQAEREVRTLQANAMKAARMSAVGAMAAGLAHELNQPLAAVVNYSAAARVLIDALALRPGPERVRVGEMLQGAAEQAVRAGEIVRRLRDYIGDAEIDPQSTQIAALVAEAVATARTSLGAEVGAAIATEVAADAGHVFADPEQLQQIFANLLRKAAEATRHLPERRILVGARRAEGGQGAEFFVADNGPGLSAEAERRAFELAAPSEPADLGLAICRAIVEAHGGRMWADRDAAGATIRFTIPDVATLLQDAGAQQPAAG